MLLGTILISCATAFASEGNPLKLDFKKQEKLFDCTATTTSTKTANATDCDGRTVSLSATESCTISASTCAAAYIASAQCADLKAQQNVMTAASTLSDCP